MFLTICQACPKLGNYRQITKWNIIVFIYCIDFDKEELYISDILKEEESLAYYYNESLEKFIKVNNNGVFEELDLVDNKIEIKENKKEK